MKQPSDESVLMKPCNEEDEKDVVEKYGTVTLLHEVQSYRHIHTHTQRERDIL